MKKGNHLYIVFLLFGMICVIVGGVLIYSNQKFTITFDTQTSLNIDKIKVKRNESIKAPETIPSKQGYVFDYWAWEGKAFDFSTKINKDITLVAVYREISEEEKNSHYIVTFFDSMNPTALPYEEIVSYGDKVHEREVYSVEGYQFEGWYLNGEKFDFNTPIIDDITLETKWEAIS